MAKGCNALANGSAGGRADQGQIKLRHANYLSALGVDLKTTWMKDARCRQEIRRDATEAYPSHARALTATPQLFRPRQETRRPALIRDRCSTWRRRAIRSLRRGEIRPSPRLEFGTRFGKHLVRRNRCHGGGVKFATASLCLFYPSLLDARVRGPVALFHQ